MRDFVVLGTDTDAGKTTFSLTWLAAFSAEYAYWKPLETGEFDSDKVLRTLPSVHVLPAIMQFREPIAPSLAARRESKTIPHSTDLALARPFRDGPVLIETFGGPFSPLNETELQIELVRELNVPTILVANSSVGAIGRTLSCLKSLNVEGVIPYAVVLMGPEDPYAAEQIERYSKVPVFSIELPETWDQFGYTRSAVIHESQLQKLRSLFFNDAVSSDLIDRDRSSVWHPYTSLRDAQDPLPVVSARMEFLSTAADELIIDAISSWWTILHGHLMPRLTNALHRGAQKLDHVIFGGATHPNAVEVAEALLRTVDWKPGGRVFYSDNGSTSVEVALKMAYQWWVHRGEPQRTLFVAFENGYHGDTFGAMAIGRDPVFFGNFEPLLFKAIQIPVSPVRLDETLSRVGSQVAAVIIEPLVQGAGGMKMHSAETLAELRAISRKHDVIFIVDEVMTAGRTGTWWAHTQANISPDLICSSKTLAGGMLPLAVTMASPEIVAGFDTDDRTKTLFHGHSFTANPLACAVAAEHLKMLAEGEWLRDVERITEFWRQHAKEFQGLPGVIDVRQQGTILAVELADVGGYLAAAGPRIRKFSLEHGVMLRPLGNVIYAMPPLQTSDRSLKRILEVMVKAIIHLHEVP